jgi:hypothetical protein
MAVVKWIRFSSWLKHCACRRCQETGLDFFPKFMPAEGTTAAFDFCGNRHVPLAAFSAARCQGLTPLIDLGRRQVANTAPTHASGFFCANEWNFPAFCCSQKRLAGHCADAMLARSD